MKKKQSVQHVVILTQVDMHPGQSEDVHLYNNIIYHLSYMNTI